MSEQAGLSQVICFHCCLPIPGYFKTKDSNPVFIECNDCHGKLFKAMKGDELETDKDDIIVKDGSVVLGNKRKLKWI